MPHILTSLNVYWCILLIVPSEKRLDTFSCITAFPHSLFFRTNHVKHVQSPSHTPVLYLRPFTKILQKDDGKIRWSLAGIRYGIEKLNTEDVSRRSFRSKDWENNINEAFRGGLALSTRARRTYMEDDSKADSSMDFDLQRRIEDSWNADRDSVASMLCSAKGDPTVGGKSLMWRTSPSDEPKMIELRTLGDGNFPYHEDPNELVRDPRYLPRLNHHVLKGFIDKSEIAGKKIKEAIDDDKFLDIADCIGYSTRITPTEKSAFLARPAFVEALQLLEKHTLPQHSWQYSMNIQSSESVGEKDKFHVTVAISNGPASPSSLSRRVGRGLTSPSPDDERDIMTKANGETLLRHINLGMNTVCDVFSQKDEIYSLSLSNQQKLERMSKALFKVMRRISSKEGMIDGHCEESHPDSKTQGTTLRLPDQDAKELIRSREEMERSMKCGDYLASLSFVLEPSGGRYDSAKCEDLWTQAQDYRKTIERLVNIHHVEDTAHIILAHEPDYGDATIQNFMIQDVTATFSEDEEEEEEEDDEI